ncbi:capsule assembly Wzi family protein [Aquiflexum sp.]|uniref:capsule assembly Wzi family protein n=1 Tax=Aquiflexum sp. TaxID=1872584 RepID=UPI003592E97E
MKNFSLLFLALILGIQLPSVAQSLPANFPIFEEYLRRKQLIDIDSSNKSSFLFKPLQFDSLNTQVYEGDFSNSKDVLSLKFLPILSTSRFNTNRPYGWGDYGMIPNVGLQQYLSGGIYTEWKFLSLQFQPEIVVAHNQFYFGFSPDFTDSEIKARFIYWNHGDYPERYGESVYSSIWWGQSKITGKFGAFEAGLATQNIWWGPGQWNALTFSNNAQGFAHFTLNTIKPAKTFLGNFEGQILSGRIDESGFAPTQDPDLNSRFFRDFSGDWKYVNAITISYNPIWTPNIFLGFARTFQVYREKMGNSFRDYFPVFTGVTKEQFFVDGNSVAFDSDGADQQISVYFRWIVPKSNFEFYGEFGRRDHALNWREFILNPEHARAYLMGFKKLFPIEGENRYFQVRGEVTHQQESINRYIRYPGLTGGITWHTHSPTRGFANLGQPLGVGIGIGSNVQTFEMAIVQNFNKFGLLLERLENHQDFYYRAQLQNSEHRPWIDLGLGFLFDHRWKNFLISSKVQFINSRNYQWQLLDYSTENYPRGKNLTSLYSQMSLIYLISQ